MRCNQCGFAFHVDYIRQEARACPICGSEDDCAFHSGMEFRVSKIEAAFDSAKAS